MRAGSRNDDGYLAHQNLGEGERDDFQENPLVLHPLQPPLAPGPGVAGPLETRAVVLAARVLALLGPASRAQVDVTCSMQVRCW